MALYQMLYINIIIINMSTTAVAICECGIEIITAYQYNKPNLIFSLHCIKHKNIIYHSL